MADHVSQLLSYVFDKHTTAQLLKKANETAPASKTRPPSCTNSPSAHCDKTQSQEGVCPFDALAVNCKLKTK